MGLKQHSGLLLLKLKADWNHSVKKDEDLESRYFRTALDPFLWKAEQLNLYCAPEPPGDLGKCRF